MIQLHDIHKSYGDGKNRFEALKGISINFRSSEFVAILGPSGSGKTTLLNVIGGLDHYDGGDLIIDEISTKRYTERDWDSYRNHSVGFIFQNYNLIPHQTILANVEMALTISGIPPKDRKERATAVLKKVGLSDHLDKLPAQLSGGQMQRVAIARALVNEPSIILADEPTGALDSKTGIQVMELIREVAKDHLVIMVTHNPELADEYASRIITLKDGNIISDNDPYEVTKEESELVTKNMGRASMTWRTAFSLSFHNLWSKRKRTVLTAFAGSIGIIGIALILALNTGVNQYIFEQEEKMAYAYPLLVNTVSLDVSSVLQDLGEFSFENGVKTDHVEVMPFVDRILNMLGTNNLRSIKEYLSKPGNKIAELGTIEYTSAIQPQIYLEYGDTVRRVCPDQTAEAAGLPVSVLENSIISSEVSTNMFFPMPSHPELYEGRYELKAGHWPQNENECILVLTDQGQIVDYLLYVMGMRDPADLDKLIHEILLGEFEGRESTEKLKYDFSDFIGIAFKVLSSDEYFTYSPEYGFYIDRRSDSDYIRNLVKHADTLRISGVVQPLPEYGMGCLKAGINYPHELLEKMISHAEKSDVVKAQLSSPETDVLTGKRFDEPASPEDLDFSSMVKIDTESLKKAVILDQDAVLSCFMKNSGLESIGLTVEDLDLKNTLDARQAADYTAGLALDFLDYLREKEILESQVYADTLSEYFSSEDFQNLLSRWEDKFTTGNLSLQKVADSLDLLINTVSDALAKRLSDRGLLLSGSIGEAFKSYEEEGRLKAYTEQFESGLKDENGNPKESFIKVIEQKVSGKVSEQVSAAVERGVQAVLQNIMDFVDLDEKQFLKSFSLNVNPSALSELLLSMTSFADVTYEGNLRKMGYEDSANPAGIEIYTSDFAAKDEVVRLLDQYNEEMELAGRSSDMVTYTDMLGSAITLIMQVVQIITTVLIAAVAVSLVVASIMIGVITYISVLERRREIGILRAMGASRKNISRIFNAETFITGLVSGALGIGLSYLILLPMNAFLHSMTHVNDIYAILPPQNALILILVASLLTTLGGLLPAHSASKSDPVEALRSE